MPPYFLESPASFAIACQVPHWRVCVAAGTVAGWMRLAPAGNWNWPKESGMVAVVARAGLRRTMSGCTMEALRKSNLHHRWIVVS